MRISQTSNRLGPDAGFTLLEILLVASLLGLLVSVATLGVNSLNREAKELRRQASLYQYLITGLIEKSVFEGRTLAIGLDDEAFRTYELDYNSSGKIPFSVMEELELDPRFSIEFVDEHLFDKTSLYTQAYLNSKEANSDASKEPSEEFIEGELDDPIPEPVIQIFAGGQVVPFQLLFKYEGYENPGLIMTVNSLGEISIEENSDE